MSFLLNRHYREWLWIAGENGKPGVTANLTATAESTRMITDPLVEVAGTNAVVGNTSVNAEGGIDVVTAAVDNDQSILVVHELANACQCHVDNLTLRTDREAEFECAIKMPSTITDLIVMAGLQLNTNPADMAVNNNGMAVFNFNEGDDSDTNWGFVTDVASGGTDLDVDTGVLVVAGGVYHFSIKYTGLGRCEARINGQLVAHLDMTGGAAVAQTPMIGVQVLENSGATEAMTVYGWRISRAIGQAR
jgi:hypothetical protein